ncbi:type VII secretion integral membrane protein EccD, partial [Nocardia cyriacigeorgica]|uniref:type VII secretion integral membrane protein EccD n=1 Tax=Nocardia cyriacigeorgica TaxID=135487 RepID=UPI0024583FE2
LLLPPPTSQGGGPFGPPGGRGAPGRAGPARVANQYQTGLLIGCAVAGVAGALGAADPLGDSRWQGIALAVVTAIILCLRGRAFADLAQAATLIIAGATIVAALLTGLALGGADPLLSGGLLLALAVAVVVFGVIGPHIEITPVTRRSGEIFEYLLICTVIPLVLWIMGVYAMARNI